MSAEQHAIVLLLLASRTTSDGVADARQPDNPWKLGRRPKRRSGGGVIVGRTTYDGVAAVGQAKTHYGVAATGQPNNT